MGRKLRSLKVPSLARLVGLLPHQVLPRRRAEVWLKGRRASMQPWRRGRVRPSTSRDWAENS